MYNGIRFTKPKEIERITETACRILEEVGVEIESPRLVEILKESFPESLWEKRGRLCFSTKLSRGCFSPEKAAGRPVSLRWLAGRKFTKAII